MKKKLNYCLRKPQGSSIFYCDFSITIEPRTDLTNHVVEDISIDDYGNKLFRDAWFYVLIGMNYAFERMSSKTF